MPNFLVPRDVAADLAATFTEYGLNAAPLPVPETLGETLPLAVIEPLGGMRTSLTIDETPVTIGVYAANEAEAQRAAALAVGILDALQYSAIIWYRCDITTLPYNDPDPRHPTLPRWSLAATVWTRPQDSE